MFELVINRPQDCSRKLTPLVVKPMAGNNINTKYVQIALTLLANINQDFTQPNFLSPGEHQNTRL